MKKEGLPDQYPGRLPLPQEQTRFFRGYEVQEGPPTDEEIKKEIEEAANMQMRRIQEDQDRENRAD